MKDLGKLCAIEWADELLFEGSVILFGFVLAHAAIHDVIADVQCSETEHFRFLADLGNDSCAADCELCAARLDAVGDLDLNFIAVDLCLFGIRLEQRHQCAVCCYLPAINHRGPDELFVNSPAVLVFGNVALGGFEPLEKHRLNRLSEDFLIQLQRARGVLDDLRRFDA